MEIAWFLILSQWCITLVIGFDLGPMVRIGQCRSECLRRHSVDGSCDWYSNRGETVCSECWQNCEALEKQWEDTRAICAGEQYLRCPACQTACTFHNTRVVEKYVPSMLPAPNKGPVSLDRYDVAIVLRKVQQQWKESGYYSANRTPSLRPDTWIIVVLEDGLKHYSWQEWVPTLESLKEGPLFEATISWRDLQTQLKKQQDLEQKRFNDRVRQFFLEKYGEKVLTEWTKTQEDVQVSQDVFRRFFFRNRDSQSDKSLEIDGSPSTSSSFPEHRIGNIGSTQKQSFVVSWEPETGGLMGNQVTDSDSAQISLLPGMKYLVRVASNDGPGSFPIEVDTRSDSPQIISVKKNFEHTWEIYTVYTCAFLLLIAIGLTKFLRRKKKNIETIEEV